VGKRNAGLPEEVPLGVAGRIELQAGASSEGVRIHGSPSPPRENSGFHEASSFCIIYAVRQNRWMRLY